jgi:hypothetical protein
MNLRRKKIDYQGTIPFVLDSAKHTAWLIDNEIAQRFL